jgi:hypothetical protein
MPKTLCPRLDNSIELSCNRFIMMGVLLKLITKPINTILTILQSNRSPKSQTQPKHLVEFALGCRKQFMGSYSLKELFFTVF